MSIFTPSTALYQDVLDYLDRRGIPSIAGIFDNYNQATNPYTIDFNKGIGAASNTIGPVVDAPRPVMPVQIEGRGDGPRGTGLFGNLDPASERMVLVDGVPTTVYTDASGLLKTFDGKNVKGKVNPLTGAFDYEFDAISPGVETYAADAPPSIFSSKEEDDEDDDEGIAGLSTGDYDYGTFGPSPMGIGGTSAFSRTARVDTAIKQGAVDLAAREAEKKRKAEEARRKAQEEAAKIERAQRAEVERIRQENERKGQGGYQSDFAQDKDFMGGEGRGRGMGAGDKGGSDTMGSF